MSKPTLPASTVRWLDERIARDPSIGPRLFEQLRSLQRALGLLHDERPTCPFLRPLIISRSQYEAVARAAEQLAKAFERLAQAALDDEALMNELDLTEREKRMARFDPGYRRLCVTSRLDAYLNGEDFHFLEYNAESPAGIADQMQLEKVLFDLPHMKEFLAQHAGAYWLPRPHHALLRALRETYREWSGQQQQQSERAPQIAIVDWEGVSTRSEFEVLKDYFEREGHPTVIADPRSLEYDGTALRVGDFRIDILYKRVVIHEFLEKFDETHPLARAYIEHKVCMVNSFRTKMAHKKAGFAILSDPAYHHLFTPEQVACIRQHIPWTRHVRPQRTTYRGEERELLDVLSTERERLVIKPNDDYGGHGVVIGWETDAAAWEEAVRHALESSFVVQERVMVEKVRMAMFTADSLVTEEMFIDFNPFLFLNTVEGALVRLSTSSLCNVSSGGGETALLVLENF